MFSWKRWTPRKFIRSVLTVETLASSMFQTKEKCDSLILSRSALRMVWRCYRRPRVRCYYFRLEPTVRKDTWIRVTSVTVMVCIRKWRFESYLITAVFKVLSQQLRGTLKTAFWKILKVDFESWIFYEHGSTYVLNL